MKKILLEACCGGAADVFAAKSAGADRAELSAALALGGLTPSLGAMELAAKAGLPIIAMVRPRSGGFCYNEYEFQTMCRDAEALLAAGAAGVAFGILLADGRVDEKRCAALLRHIGDRQSVFHRAFDVTPDWREAMDRLCGLGVTHILTSGQAPSALEGAQTLAHMIEYAGGRIEILPGGGIRTHNAAELIHKTGCDQLHASLSATCADPSIPASSAIRFGGHGLSAENLYTHLDAASFQSLVNLLQTEISLCDMRSESI
ncbi:MAG: copper homeostasis protein CutC [Candidatus Pelethousia sp.]|nr:copper homeostasis protein CutC [Candidatus Pelethousia sp.]